MEQKLGQAKRLYFEKSLVSSNFEGFNTDASFVGLMANVIPFLKPPADAIPGMGWLFYKLKINLSSKLWDKQSLKVK